MPIIIKEIQIKTTIERKSSQSAVTEEQLTLLKNSILKEMKDAVGKQTLKRKER